MNTNGDNTSIRLPFGLKNGQLLHISEVESGLKCECICPACNSELVAKKGPKQTHHFSHHNAPECTHALESALHLYAKEIIEQRKKFMIPPYFRTIEEFGRCKLTEEKLVHIDRVYLEKRLGDFVPDIIVESKGHQLLVEIAVTHFVDEEKYYKIRGADVSTIEVDLSPLQKTGFSKCEIEAAVIDGYINKHWIHNAKWHHLSEAFIRRKKNEAAKQAYERAKKEKEKAKLEEFYASYKMPIQKREAGSGSVWHIDGCPFKKRKFDTTDKSREFYANVEADCYSCDSFRGFRDEKRNIICLGEYHKRK